MVGAGEGIGGAAGPETADPETATTAAGVTDCADALAGIASSVSDRVSGETTIPSPIRCWFGCCCFRSARSRRRQYRYLRANV